MKHHQHIGIMLVLDLVIYMVMVVFISNLNRNLFFEMKIVCVELPQKMIQMQSQAMVLN